MSENLIPKQPDVSHIPEDSPYWREKPSIQRAWLQADRVVESPPSRFRKWLDAEGLPDVPPRTRSRASITKTLVNRGVGESAKLWRIESYREMKKWKLKMLPPEVCRELVWRLVESKIVDFLPQAEEGRMAVEAVDVNPTQEIEGMEFLPDWMRWVAMHPGLLIAPEAAAGDPLVKKKCDEYLKAYPCPHQAAMNQFLLYRGNEKLLDGLFKEIGRLHQAATKLAEAKSLDENLGEESAEQKAIATLAEVFNQTEQVEKAEEQIIE